MRNRILIALALFIAFLIPAHSNAQTRVLLGASGGDSFDNYSFGVQAGLEVPFAKHYELDLQDTFSPIESHVSLGAGRANIASVGGQIWFSPSWGINGRVEDSAYNVTKVTKDADYAFGGLTYRAVVGGLPARFSFDYIRQFNNGISPSGLESSHLQGADFGFTVRFGCFSAFCVRTSEDFVFGRVLTQSNPICDGTFGVTGGPGGGACPRASAFGGGVTASILLEFPRHRGHEYDRF
jgi:hypothetical protein